MTGTDNLSPEDRRRTMKSVRSQNTTPELAVRRILFRLGYRYRLNRKDLPGRPDLVFPGRRKIVFIHGCFWHGQPGAELAWASFPCQDLSLAGAGQGLNGTRSGSFWGFWRLMRQLVDDGRPVPLIVLENVVGTISANKGKDFSVLLGALVDAGYSVGPMVIDAQYFLPQSRPRLFVIAVHDSVELPDSLVQSHPDPRWHTSGVVRANGNMPSPIKERWIWWNMPYPPPRTTTLLDILEENPTGVQWRTSC